MESCYLCIYSSAICSCSTLWNASVLCAMGLNSSAWLSQLIHSTVNIIIQLLAQHWCEAAHVHFLVQLCQRCWQSVCIFTWLAYWFPRTAVTKLPQSEWLKITETDFLRDLSGGQKSEMKVSTGLCSLKSLGMNPCLFQLLVAASLDLWPHHISLPSSSHGLLMSASSKDTCHCI